MENSGYNVTPVTGPNVQANGSQSNMQQQQQNAGLDFVSSQKSNQSENLKKLLNEIQKVGEEIANDNRVSSQQQSSTNSEQFPSSSSNRDSGGNQSTSTDYTRDDEYDYQIEREIIRQVQLIKMNADKYGEVTDVVGRRAVLARSSTGRGNGYQFEYLLADGRIVSTDECWELANAGKLRNIIGSHNKGRKYIRSAGDGIRDNNLSSLPGF